MSDQPPAEWIEAAKRMSEEVAQVLDDHADELTQAIREGLDGRP